METISNIFKKIKMEFFLKACNDDQFYIVRSCMGNGNVKWSDVKNIKYILQHCPFEYLFRANHQHYYFMKLLTEFVVKNNLNDFYFIDFLNMANEVGNVLQLSDVFLETNLYNILNNLTKKYCHFTHMEFFEAINQRFRNVQELFVVLNPGFKRSKENMVLYN